MRQTRRAILESIKKRQHATVNDLARDVTLSPITIRHHLYALEADGLIKKTALRNGVGRPVYRYSLTDAAMNHFPNRYHVLTTHLLSMLKDLEPESVVRQLLDGTAGRLCDSLPPLDHLSTEERLHALQSHFQTQGVAIKIETMPDGDIQAVIGCPYYHVGQHHPEVCRIDETLIGEALQTPVAQTSCLLHGDESCTFSIKSGESLSSRREPS